MDAIDTMISMPVREVHIDGIAIMKIMKHCNENLPTMVAGSLLGIDVDGILEVTYSYPFPAPKIQSSSSIVQSHENDDGEILEDIDSTEYQIEMMKMLRDVHMDNNCVGWYQSSFMETIYTNDVISYQYSYQCSDELSDNSVVIMYDPIQSRKGYLVVKAFRLSEEFIKLKKNKSNAFIKPSSILQELPVRIKNGAHISAFLRCFGDTNKSLIDSDFDSLSMATSDMYLEKRLELVSGWIEDLVQEQQKFQAHAKVIAKPRMDHIRWLNKVTHDNIDRREGGEELLSTNLETSGLRPLPDAPTRTEPLLMIGQLDRYCSQITSDALTTSSKLFITAQMYNATNNTSN
jgi:translation initiation factor 3 subunit H